MTMQQNTGRKLTNLCFVTNPKVIQDKHCHVLC